MKSSPGFLTPSRECYGPDIVIGFVTNYDYAKIEPWIVSLERCGFEGVKAVMAYNMAASTIKKLEDKGFNVAFHTKDSAGNAYYNSPRAIVVQRFLDLWKLSRAGKWGSDNGFRNVITTDVKDVIFQRNPSEFLEHVEDDGKTINVGSESITYAQEPWGNENLFMSFGSDVFESMRENVIYNCGTISGRADVMEDLALNIYLLSCNAPVHNADQAALNVILNMRPWKQQTRFNNLLSGYACQAGTTNDPSKINEFKPFLQEGVQPFLGEDGLVKFRDPITQQDTPFYLVHQYDRVPYWKKIIEQRYREGTS